MMYEALVFIAEEGLADTEAQLNIWYRLWTANGSDSWLKDATVAELKRQRDDLIAWLAL